MKWLVGVVFVVGCHSSGGQNASIECGAGTVLQGAQCVPTSALVCGTGTHDDNGMCVPDPTLQLRATPTLTADGRSATEVVVVGIEPDGSPSHDHVVLSVNRPSAGTLVSPVIMIDDIDGESAFVPCNSALAADCVGPATFSVALASAPQVPLASVDVELVAPAPIGSAAPCLTGGNVMYLDGTGYGYDGEQTFASQGVDAAHTGVFDPTFIDDTARINMSVLNGPLWSLWFSSRELGVSLVPSTYRNAVQADTAKPGQPGFYPIGQGDLPANCTAFYEFQIETYSANELTASFNITCQFEPTKTMTGCVHFSN